MLPSSLLTRAALLLALGAAPAAAQPAGDSISLRFGWPDTVRARVEQEWTRVQEAPGRSQTERAVTRYRLRVTPHAEGRLLRADSFVVVSTGAADTTSAPVAATQLALARLAALQPSYVVSAAGAFVRLDDAAATKAAIDSLLAPIVAQVRSAPPQLVAMLAASTSEEALAAAAQDEWNVLVARWAGDWEIGRARVHSSEQPVRLWQGLSLTVSHEARVAARVPCAAAETALRCVRLEMRSRPDPEGMRRLVQRLLEELTPGQARQIAGLISSLDSEVTLGLVADAATLAPYELVETRRVRVRREGRRPVTETRVDTRTKRFVYER